MSHQATDNQVDSQRAASDALAKMITRQNAAIESLMAERERLRTAYAARLAAEQRLTLLLKELREVASGMDDDDAAFQMADIGVLERHEMARHKATETARAEFESFAHSVGRLDGVLVRLQERQKAMTEAAEGAPSISLIGASL